MLFPPAGPDVEQPRRELKPVLRDDPKAAAGKIAIFQYTAVGVFVFLITGFWALQVQNEDYYAARAERNRIKFVPILAPRGKILDRDGRVIVDNHSSFSLILSREHLKEENLRPIADGLQLDYEELVERLERFRRRPRYEALVVKEEMTPADLAFVDSHRTFFPELEVIPAQRRLYPQNGFAAHVLGYTGEISEYELNLASFAHYNPGDVIGKFGIERQYNETLMGIDGQRQVLVDNRGQPRQVLGLKDAVPGKDIQLTLDLDLQAVAELAMEGRKGALVALDPRNGEVLAMVSRPAFDPNKFAVRIRTADWREIVDNPDNPLLNRAIQAQLAPGSTFKPIVQLAGLETGSIDPQWSATCRGGAVYYGRFFKCWQRKGHGAVSAVRAMAQSCDVYFYNLGNRLGVDTIAHFSEQAGLGARAGIDLPHEAAGIVPSQQWVMRNFRRRWYAGETISVAIGQGALTVTPLQLARAIGGIAMGGVWHHPHLLKELSRTEKPHVMKLDPANVQTVIDGMYAVANEAGTGMRARLPGVEVCGKTGTAQLASNQYLAGKGNVKDLRDNAWYVGFASRTHPEIVVAVLWEHGEAGSMAGPIVRDVIKAYYDKKARLAGKAAQPVPPIVQMEGAAEEEEHIETSPEPPEPATESDPQP